MFVPVRQCAKVMTRLRKLNVKITLQGHVMYPSMCARFMSTEPFERFSLSIIQLILSVRRCAEPMT